MRLQCHVHNIILSLKNCPLSVRNLIVDKAQTDPIQLARMVEYIRKQVHHMDSIESQQILNIGSVTLLPFTGTTEQ